MLDIQLFGPVTEVLAFLTLIGQIALVLLLLLLLIVRFAPDNKLSKKSKKYLKLVAKHSIPIVFLFSLIAVVFSLFYSEMVGLDPCKLCWWQRIFIYPQAIIYGLAIWKKKEKSAAEYGIVLALLALAVGVYQYTLQVSELINPHDPLIADCAADASETSCSSTYLLAYGYITMPLMSITSSLYIILVLGVRKMFNIQKVDSR